MNKSHFQQRGPWAGTHKRKLQRARKLAASAAGALVLAIPVLLLPLIIAALLIPKVSGTYAMAAMPFILLDSKPGEGGGGGALTTEQFQQKVLTGMEAVKTKVDGLEGPVGKITQIETDVNDLKTKANESATAMAELRKQRLSKLSHIRGPRQFGQVSDGLARTIAAQFIVHCERSGKMEALASVKTQRESLLDVARGVLEIDVKTALSTSDIPLPVEYGSEIRELISDFGVVRGKMFPYPIGMGTARPARMGTRPAFGSIAMSAAMTEKSPTVTFASLESHKIGGLVRLPREIDEQSIVPMGQFLARYGAVEFARAEDTWGFLADGSGTYETVKGIVQIARDNTKTVVLASTKTHPSDAVLADFRSLRTKVNKAALNGKVSAYYLDSTWETVLRTFNTTSDLYIYIRNPDGSATFDGYPIVWTDVLQAYTTSAVVDTPIAVFGALQFWWMGEHGSPRIDTSEHVFFANDQLAVRFIEEIDFDYAAVDATAALITAAS